MYLVYITYVRRDFAKRIESLQRYKACEACLSRRRFELLLEFKFALDTPFTNNLGAFLTGLNLGKTCAFQSFSAVTKLYHVHFG